MCVISNSGGESVINASKNTKTSEKIIKELQQIKNRRINEVIVDSAAAVQIINSRSITRSGGTKEQLVSLITIEQKQQQIPAEIS